MTRKITRNMYMTLDGYGEFPKYPGSDVPSKEPGEGFADFWINRYDSVDTIVFGRRSFEDHLAFHSEAARKPSDPEYLFEFSRFLDRIQKKCVSPTLPLNSDESSDWAFCEEAFLRMNDLKMGLDAPRCCLGSDQ